MVHRRWKSILCPLIASLMVNVPDLLIFLFKAKPGPMRSHMLVFDGLATLLPIVLAV
jgi:hypothetical protein